VSIEKGSPGLFENNR